MRRLYSESEMPGEELETRSSTPTNKLKIPKTLEETGKI